MFMNGDGGPRLQRSWLEILVAVVMGAVVIALITLAVSPVKAQDCVDEASTMRLFVEIAERGFDRYGCDTEHSVMARWTPAPDPDGDDWFELKVWGVGPFRDMSRTYKMIYADSLETWWPAYTETLWAIVRALDPDGASAWSDTSDAFVFIEGAPNEALSLPALRD